MPATSSRIGMENRKYFSFINEIPLNELQAVCESIVSAIGWSTIYQEQWLGPCYN